MEITVKRINDAVRFEGTNSEGNRVIMEGGPGAGGEGQGIRPMELVLMSVAACSSIDLVLILKKMRQELLGLDINVKGDRATDEVPAIFKSIHLHFILSGDLKPAKAERALKLSVDKYCSVATMLQHTTNITFSYEIISG